MDEQKPILAVVLTTYGTEEKEQNKKTFVMDSSRTF
jgi:hypothetical protein